VVDIGKERLGYAPFSWDFQVTSRKFHANSGEGGENAQANGAGEGEGEECGEEDEEDEVDQQYWYMRVSKGKTRATATGPGSHLILVHAISCEDAEGEDKGEVGKKGGKREGEDTKVITAMADEGCCTYLPLKCGEGRHEVSRQNA